MVYVSVQYPFLSAISCVSGRKNIFIPSISFLSQIQSGAMNKNDKQYITLADMHFHLDIFLLNSK